MTPRRSTWLAMPTITPAFVASIALFLAVAFATGGCLEKDPEENFNLWSNNQAGWVQMGKFVADTKNDAAIRTRALEVLTLNGHPSQVLNVAQSAPDKDKLLLDLRERLGKALKNPNEKLARYAKQVLFGLINALPEAEKASTRKIIAEWAFGDLSQDDQAKMVAEKLGRRMRPEEIEALGKEGVKGGEIMLSKGIARMEVMTFLSGVKTEESKLALVNGLRRYHKAHKNVKVTNAELGALQGTKHLEALLYFMELYERLDANEHPDDKQASSLAIAAAMEWLESEDGKKMMKKHYKERFKPVAERFLVRKNCDDRWWAAQTMIHQEGIDGLKKALTTLPDDTNYGLEEFAHNDFKMMLTDLCLKDITKLDQAKVREALLASLASKRVIERIFAIRCLIADDSSEAYKALKKYGKKDNLIIDPIIVPPVGEEVTISELASVAVDVMKYHNELDKLLAKGKITKNDVKWRLFYADYSFDRKGKVLRKYAESRAGEKIARDKAKAEKKIARDKAKAEKKPAKKK